MGLIKSVRFGDVINLLLPNGERIVLSFLKYRAGQNITNLRVKIDAPKKIIIDHQQWKEMQENNEESDSLSSL